MAEFYNQFLREPAALCALAGGGKPGVLFFSLDAANRLAVRVARWAFHLPYFDAAIRLERQADQVRYRSEVDHATTAWCVAQRSHLAR